MNVHDTHVWLTRTATPACMRCGVVLDDTNVRARCRPPLPERTPMADPTPDHGLCPVPSRDDELQALREDVIRLTHERDLHAREARFEREHAVFLSEANAEKCKEIGRLERYLAKVRNDYTTAVRDGNALEVARLAQVRQAWQAWADDLGRPPMPSLTDDERRERLTKLVKGLFAESKRMTLAYEEEVEKRARAQADAAQTGARLARVEEWTHEFGRALNPRGADTYGEGVRESKADVARLLLRRESDALA